MSTADMKFGVLRELLSEAIVESLKSWPEIQRRIFIEVHYGGRSVEEISRSYGMRQSEVLQILRHSEGKLYQALKIFRSASSENVSGELPHYSDYFEDRRCCY